MKADLLALKSYPVQASGRSLLETLKLGDLETSLCYLISSMKLIINGQEKLTDAASVAALVAELGMKGDRVAVELNREIVPRAAWEQAALHDGDRLEIVHFVGGG